jgi:hypothetical protein
MVTTIGNLVYPPEDQCIRFASFSSFTRYMHQLSVHFATPPTVAGIDGLCLLCEMKERNHEEKRVHTY